MKTPVLFFTLTKKPMRMPYSYSSCCFSACGPTYQYLTVDFFPVAKRSETTLQMENDTMQLTYDFSGHGGQFTITVFNKTNQPYRSTGPSLALIN